MGSIPDQFPLSIRAWPAKDDDTTALTSLISRINTERGNFRNVTEESLAEEIKQETEGVGSDRRDEGSDGDEVEEGPDRIKELATAREDILAQLEQAHNSSVVALDFVSLLLSKDTPVQASLSISPGLREAVSLGTLGSDKLSDSRVLPAQREDNKRVAKGWKLQGLNNTVDTLLDSASRLEKEIETETRYWEQVLTISEKGWAICRIPQEKHTLGVRFGFSESAPAFKNRSLGALRRNADGSIYLDQGIADSTPKRLRVRIQTNGTVTGEAPPSVTIPDPTSVEALVLSARNTIFEEELWQEVNREARILANYGARLTGDDITCPISATKSIILDLVSINEDDIEVDREYKHDDKSAGMISLSLHLLLSYAHRQNMRRRSQHPPPLTMRPPANPPYWILRAILAFLHRQNVLSTISALLTPLSAALRRAGVTTEVSTFTIPSLDISNTSGRHIPEQIVESLTSNLSGEFTLPLTASQPKQTLHIPFRTSTDPRYAIYTRFFITATGPVASSCRPPPELSSVNDVKDYVLWAVACAVAESFADKGDDEVLHAGEDGRETSGWAKTHDPTTLRKTINNDKDIMELTFRVKVTEDSKVEVQAIWKALHIGGVMQANKNISKRFVWDSDGKDYQKDLRTIVKELSLDIENVTKSPPRLVFGDDGSVRHVEGMEEVWDTTR